MSISERADADWLGLWFDLFEQGGQFMSFPIALLRKGRPPPNWELVRHREFDGIGALAHALRQEGIDPGELPRLSPLRLPPAWRKPFLIAQQVWLARARRVAWRRFDDDAIRNRPSGVAWIALSKEETAALITHARRLGVTANSLLLAALHDVTIGRFIEPGKGGHWIVPVNVRGAISASRDTANHSVPITVDIAPRAEALKVHSTVHGLLDSGLAWASLQTLLIGKLGGTESMQKLVNAYYEKKSTALGMFSNLGAWNPASYDDVDAVLFAPPASTWYPIAAGCVTYRGRLSLALQIHGALAPGENAHVDYAAPCLRDWLAGLGTPLSSDVCVSKFE